MCLRICLGEGTRRVRELVSVGIVNGSFPITYYSTVSGILPEYELDHAWKGGLFSWE